MRAINFLYVFLTVMMIIPSCAVANVSYFSDKGQGHEEIVYEKGEIRFEPGDKISIIINSKDPALSNLFNLPYISRQLGVLTENMANNAFNNAFSSYTIDNKGCIDFPVLGKISVMGMTRNELSDYIKHRLVTENLLKDPIVTIEYVNLTFAVLGEVNRPGRFSIDKDKISLLEALGMAGDMTIYGLRDRILIQREEGGKTVFFRVDISSGSSLYSSPAYYLKQNDVIYVEPNKYKSNDSTVNNKAMRWSSILLTAASVLTTISIAIFK